MHALHALSRFASACCLLLAAGAAPAADTLVQGSAPPPVPALSLPSGATSPGSARAGSERARVAGEAHSPEPAALWLGLAGVAALTLRRIHEVTRG